MGCFGQIEETTKFVNLFLFLFLRLENGVEGAVWSQRLFPKLKDFCPGQIRQARSTQSTLWIQKIHPGNKEELSSQVFSWVTSFCIIFFKKLINHNADKYFSPSYLKWQSILVESTNLGRRKTSVQCTILPI